MTHDRTKTSGKSWQRAGTIIRQRVAQQTLSSENLRIKAGITAAVVAGELREGDQLPPEPRVAELTGISLGTVRRALAKLAVEGIVERIHGRGTFISNYSRHLNENWHMRFVDPVTRTMVACDTHLLERKLIDEAGPWSRYLGERERFVRLRRLGIVAGNHYFINELTLESDHFMDLIHVPVEDIEKGVRLLISKQFQRPILSSRRTVKIDRLSREMAILMKAQEGDRVLKVTVVTLTFDDEPVFYSEMWVPEMPYEMDLTPINQSLPRGVIPV